MKNKLFGVSVIAVFLFSCSSIEPSTPKTPVELPTSVIGKWQMIQEDVTYLLTYHEDSTYTVEVYRTRTQWETDSDEPNKTPLEVGVFTFTDNTISVKPSHVYSKSLQKLKEVPDDATTVVMNYQIEGNQMILQDFGTFVYLGK